MDEWGQVETEDDVIRYLELLAADAGSRAAREASTAWSTDDLPGVFHGWACWLDGVVADAPSSELVAMPSRRTLAGHLFHARSAGRGAPVESRAVVIDDPEQVSSAADLAAWLRYLRDDCLADEAARRRRSADGGWGGGDWAHGTALTAYLEAWHACLLDQRSGARRTRFRARSWSELAEALEIGRVYE